MEKIDNFDEAKFFINNQLDKQFKEDGINEMWLIMLAYIASVEGDTDKAKYYFNEQTKMTNPDSIFSLCLESLTEPDFTLCTRASIKNYFVSSSLFHCPRAASLFILAL